MKEPKKLEINLDFLDTPAESGADDAGRRSFPPLSSDGPIKKQGERLNNAHRPTSKAGLVIIGIFLLLIVVGLIARAVDQPSEQSSSVPTNQTPSLGQPILQLAPSGSFTNGLDSQTRCLREKGAYAKVISGECPCLSGYQVSSQNGECITDEQYCKEFDMNSLFNSALEKCACRNGYRMSVDSGLCVLDCKSSECRNGDACTKKPDNSFCNSTSLKGWTCSVGYKDLGSSCSKIESGNGCPADYPLRLESADWYQCYSKCPEVMYPIDGNNGSIFLPTTENENGICRCEPGYEPRWDPQPGFWRCIGLAR